MAIHPIDGRRKIAEEFAKEAVKRYGDRIEEIILYGSVARGESHGKSDIDVLVISEEPRYKFIRKLGDLTFPVLLDRGELISTTVMSKGHFRWLKGLNSFFVKNVLNDGVVLYKAGKAGIVKGA